MTFNKCYISETGSRLLCICLKGYYKVVFSAFAKFLSTEHFTANLCNFTPLPTRNWMTSLCLLYSTFVIYFIYTTYYCSWTPHKLWLYAGVFSIHILQARCGVDTRIINICFLHKKYYHRSLYSADKLPTELLRPRLLFIPELLLLSLILVRNV